MIGKIQGNIVDLLYAPLSATEVTVSIALAAVTRSVMIAIESREMAAQRLVNLRCMYVKMTILSLIKTSPQRILS